MTILDLRESDLAASVQDVQSGTKRIWIKPKPQFGNRTVAFLEFTVQSSSDPDGQPPVYYILGSPKARPYVRVRTSTANGSSDDVLGILVPPYRSVKFRTEEYLALSGTTAGMIFNSYAVALSGLQIVAGKINPGFGPDSLAVVAQNLSPRTVVLRPGDRIFSVAISTTDGACDSIVGRGHGDQAPRFEQTMRERFVDSFYRPNAWFVAILTAIATLAGTLAAVLLLRVLPGVHI